MCKGLGVSPANLTITESDPYSFGTRPTGSAVTHTFTVTNTGGLQATSIAGSGLAAPYSFTGGSFPGSGGNCTATLNPAASCLIEVEYAPVSVSPVDDDTININYFDGVVAQVSSRDVTGVAVAPADLTISEADPYNYGTLATGATATHTFTITNDGDFQATAMTEIGVGTPYRYFGGAYPGTGGNCAGTLAASATCTIVVEYAPSVPSVANNDTINFSYFDGVNPQNSTRDITGVAVPPAALSISEVDPYDFGTFAIGSTANHIFTVSNGGGFTASSVNEVGLGLPFRFRGGTYPGTGGNCTGTLAPAASCTLDIEYAPTATGLATDTISLSYDNGAVVTTADRDIQGTGAAPANITITETDPYDYGSVTQGAADTHTFTLNNTGGVTATGMAGAGLTSPFSFLGGSYPGTGGTCGGSLAAAGACTIVVEFAPLALALQSDTIEINYVDGAGPQTSTRDVQGTGIAPASITISETDPFDFGLIADGGTTTHVFTLTNSGASVATGLTEVGLAPPFRFLGGGYPGTGGNCAGTLAAGGGNCTIVVQYAPTAINTDSDTIDISYNDGAAPQNATRDIQGTAGAPALLTYSGVSPYNYGTRATGSTTEQTFTVTNTGAVTATSMADAGTMNTPFVWKGGAYPGVGGTCAGDLASSATCTIIVEFQPGINGLQTDQIEINYNNGAILTSSTHDVQGTGANPANLTITESDPYDFGNVTVTGTSNHIFTVTNGGGVIATTMSEVSLSAPFRFVGGTYPGTTGTCGVTLPASGTCTLNVEFAPVGTGLSTSTISLSYFNGALTQNSDRDVQGTGVAAANLTITESDPYSYDTRPTGSVNDFTFTITNTGGSTATGMAGAGLVAPFSFAGGAYPGGGTCAATLAPAGTCTIIVRYEPTVVDPLDTDTIEITYSDGVAPQTSTRDVQGTAVAPALLTISETDPYNYGTLATGATDTHTFTVTNGGGVQATAMTEIGIAAPYRYFGGSFPGTGGDCAATLNPTDSCSIVVEYAPTIPSVADNDTINFSYNNGVSPQNATRDVTGVAVTPANITITESDPYDFGSLAVGATTNHIFTLNNTGGFTASSMVEVGLGGDFGFVGGTYPGTTGTCGATLAPATTCTINVEFAPSSTGLKPDTISISYNDGASTVTSDRDIQGTGAAAANITITETDPYDFGSVTQNGSDTHVFTLQNTGGVTATSVGGTGLVAPFTFLGGSFPGTGGTCGGSIAASASCNIVVEFAPTITGVQSDSIEINYIDGAAPQTSTRDVQGTGIPPANITISGADPVDFGLIAVNGTTSLTFTLTNSGSSLATGLTEVGLAPPFDFLGGSYPGTGGNCGATLAAGGGTCNIVIQYAPTVLNVDTDTLDISYNDGAVPANATRDVQGTAGAPATLDFAGTDPYDYGTRARGSTVDQTFTITNNGAVTATSISDGGGLASPFDWVGGTYPGVGGTCGGTLNSFASCTVVVEFAPGINGLQTDQINLTFDNGAGLVSSLHDIQGTGADPALLNISEADPYDFGGYAVGSGTNHIFTVTNGGGVQATSMSEVGIGAPFTFTGGGGYPGTGGNCGATLAASGSCTIDVTFTAASTGVAIDTISMSYNNGVSVQNSNRDIQGTGLSAANLTISEADPYDFGNVTVGVSGTTHTFTITNSGGSAASSMSGSGLASPFQFLGGSYPGTGGTCNTGLAAAGTCTVVVEFAPTIAGLASATMDINYNDGVNPQTVSRDVQGTGLTPATLTISETNPYNFGSITVGNTGQHTFNVTYGGQSLATSVGGSGLNPPYAFLGGAYPGTGGTCGTTISSNCTIVVTYTPIAPSGADNDTISIDFNNGAGMTSSTRDVTGQAVAPASLTLSETDTFDVGSAVVGATTNHIFVLTNGGGTQATSIAEIGLAPPFRFTGGTYPGTGGNCGVTLAPATPCNLDIEFAPTATGTPTDTINISYNNGVTTQNATRAIEGTGVAPADLTISDGATYNFGVHLNATTAQHTFTINNVGGTDATSVTGSGLGAPYQFLGGGGYPGTGGTCTGTITAGSNCTIVVSFTPSSAGVANDTIEINYDDGANPQTSTRGVTGTGSDVPDPPTSITLSSPATSPGNINTPTINLSGGDVGNGTNTYRIYTDAACTDPANLVGTASGSTLTQAVTLSTPLVNGSYNLYATLENGFGFVSACSTANVAYEYDGVNPAGPTTVTVTAWHDNLTTSPTFTWVNSASGDTATHEVAIADNAPGTNVVFGWNDAAMAGTYAFSGIGLAECTQYWPVVRAVDNAGNISSPAPSGTPFRVDVNNPGQPGGGTISLSSFATGTQGEVASWTASIEACGVDYYEMAVGSGTTGAAQFDISGGWENIGNVLTYQPIDGDGIFTFTGPMAEATDYYISVRAVDLSGKTGLASVSPAFQTTAPNAITDLTYADRSSSSMTLFWSDPGSLGAAVTDYNIYWRPTGPGPWTQFVDGVSTNTLVEVTGLTASTTYDFMVRASNGSEAPDSNIVTETTGPNSPLFDPTQFAAINVGGATGCRVMAFEADTDYQINGGPVQNLVNAGDSDDFACAAYDIVEADKPIYVMGRRGNHHIGWQTSKFSGTDFLTSLTRAGPHNIYVYAFEATTITVNRNGAFYDSQAVAANTGYTFTGIGVDGIFEIVSSGGLFVVFTDSGTNDDPKILPPKANKLIGFPSRTGYLSAEGAETVTVNSTAFDNYTVVVDDSQEYSVATGAASYSGDAFVMTTSGSVGIAVNSNADQNGNCSAPFMPPSMMSNRFIVAGGTSWVAMASTLPISIEEVNAATGAVITTHVMTGTSLFGGIYRLNLSGDYEGRIFRATTTGGRFHMWYEPNSSQSYQRTQDETLSFGWD
jgi:hypothetical protein